MNATGYDADSTTVYFRSADDAESARRDLIRQGVPQQAVSLESERGGGGFMESLKRFFGAGPTDEYAGGAILSVRGAAQTGPEMLNVIRRYGGQVQTDYAGDTSSDYSANRTDSDRGTEEQRMRLREERLSVNKTPVQEGEVRLRKEVVTENQRIDVPVQHEEVYVERRGVSDAAAAGESDIGEGEEIRIPVMRDEVTVEKHQVVADEVAVGKRTVQENQTVGANVRKERARIETDGNVSTKGTIDDTAD